MAKTPYKSEQPYNHLPLLPPKISLTTKIFGKTIAANKALAELKGLAGLIPNQAIILNTLTLKEAKDSSEIENIVTTQDELYKAFSTDNSSLDPAVKEVLNYREALWYGYQFVKKKQLITSREIIKIQEILVGNNAGIRKQPGTALKNARTGEVIYTPPFGKDIIENLLRNLEEYINEEKIEIDPLIKMAIIHYQFESIHPFYDGNGRTGRILNVLYLILQDLLELPILYLSSYIIKNKKKYYEGLQEVRLNNKWEDWILYMLDSVEQTSKDTIRLIKAIKISLDETLDSVKKKNPKIYSKELVEALFNQPYCRISMLEERLSVTRFTASKYLKELEETGLLKGEKVGRDMLYINLPLYNILRENN
jgi:Fic family protein